MCSPSSLPSFKFNGQVYREKEVGGRLCKAISASTSILLPIRDKPKCLRSRLALIDTGAAFSILGKNHWGNCHYEQVLSRKDMKESKEFPEISGIYQGKLTDVALAVVRFSLVNSRQENSPIYKGVFRLVEQNLRRTILGWFGFLDFHGVSTSGKTGEVCIYDGY